MSPPQTQMVIRLFGTTIKNRDELRMELAEKKPSTLVIESYIEDHMIDWLNSLSIPFVTKLVLTSPFCVGDPLLVNDLLLAKPHIKQLGMKMSRMHTEDSEKIERLLWVMEKTATVTDWEFDIEIGKCDKIIGAIIRAADGNTVIKSVRGFTSGTRDQNKRNADAAEKAFQESEKTRPDIRAVFPEFAKQ